MKALVVHYSRTDITKKAAEVISNHLSSDIERIVEKKNRLGIIGYISAGRDARKKKLTEIEDLKLDPAQYDLVVIGTPIWAFTVSKPVRTYLAKQGEKLRKIAFFCTCGGDSGNAFEKMESLCGKKPLATLELTKAEVMREEHLSKVRALVDEISVGG